jgi:polyhydroxyalkanoate synthesis regulator phasin
MMELIKKSMLTGIGLALVAKDEVEDIAKDLQEKMNLNEKEGREFLSDVQKRYDEAQNRLEERVERAVKDVLKRADVVTGDELKALKKEIRELKKAVGKEKADAAASE